MVKRNKYYETVYFRSHTKWWLPENDESGYRMSGTKRYFLYQRIWPFEDPPDVAADRLMKALEILKTLKKAWKHWWKPENMIN